MNLQPIGSNQTVLTVQLPQYRGDTKILFSYQTPVAALNLSPEFYAAHGSSAIRTSTRHSVTTSRHINKWLQGGTAAEVDQAVLSGMV